MTFKMQHSALLCCFVAASLTGDAGAFSIKGAGSGVSVIPTGDLKLFDPNEDGLLQGTNVLSERVSSGAKFTIAPSQTIVDNPPAGAEVESAQHFLEHLDADGELPLNFAKPNQPVTATVLGRAKLIDDDAPGDIEHVIMKLPEGFHYVEGQSLSVIPPGVDAKSGRKHKPRLYSIASTRYGDVLDGNTIRSVSKCRLFVWLAFVGDCFG